LISQCQQAPFGRGEKTVLDTEVRRVWELNPDQYRKASRLGAQQWRIIL
jgi:hypothetical protein